MIIRESDLQTLVNVAESSIQNAVVSLEMLEELITRSGAENPDSVYAAQVAQIVSRALRPHQKQVGDLRGFVPTSDDIPGESK